MTTAMQGRLLIVDDEAELLAALCEILADQGFETVGARNGAEGLKLIKEQRFDGRRQPI